MKCLWLLIRTIKQIKPDIIHTHTPKAGLLGMLAGRYCNVQVRMHTVAGLPLMESGGIKRRILELTERMTYAAATKVYPNSKGLETFITNELKVNPSKLRIIGRGSSNGINTDYFTSTDELRTQRELIRDKYDISKRDIVFSFVGRIVKDKGIVELVTAFRKLTERKAAINAPKYFLILVGPFEEDLDPLPVEVMTFLKQSSNVILPGFQKDVRPWLLASDIFVFPSYREGFPNVVMQASLLEVPCIVSDINGCNEIIEDKVTGLIVPPKSDSALLAAMTTLANDPTLCKQYATKARAFVADNFDRNRVWEGIRLEYETLMSNVECRIRGSTVLALHRSLSVSTEFNSLARIRDSKLTLPQGKPSRKRTKLVNRNNRLSALRPSSPPIRHPTFDIRNFYETRTLTRKYPNAALLY